MSSLVNFSLTNPRWVPVNFRSFRESLSWFPGEFKKIWNFFFEISIETIKNLLKKSKSVLKSFWGISKKTIRESPISPYGLPQRSPGVIRESLGTSERLHNRFLEIPQKLLKTLLDFLSRFLIVSMEISKKKISYFFKFPRGITTGIP